MSWKQFLMHSVTVPGTNNSIPLCEVMHTVMGTPRKKFTREQVIDALRATGGFITHAAEVLGCCYVTIENYIKDDPSIAVENEQIKEHRLDIAESVVIATMEGSDTKEKMDAAKFYLRYMGRTRGYIKAQKIEISDNLSELMEAADKRKP